MKKIIAILLSISIILALCTLSGCKNADEISKPQITQSTDTQSDTASQLQPESEPESEPEYEVKPEPVPQVQNFSLTSLDKNDVTTTQSTVTLAGSSDLNVPLLLNGEAVERIDNGGFSVKKDLKIGNNIFTFTYGEKKYTYTVRYKYILVDSYSPKSKQTFESGSVFSVSVKARAGSTVTAAFNGKTLTLKKEVLSETEVSDGDFVNFIGSFELPSGNTADKNLGKVKFVAKYSGASETYSSGDIICKKDSKVKYIAEVTNYTAETFDGATQDDKSNPRNNYLPQGTVDYCESGIVYDPDSGNQYYKLQCGRRIYAKDNISKRYEGILPDHNELEVKSVEKSGNHTNITLKTLYKAPFKLDLFPQKYNNEAKRDFTVQETTYEYVQIIFCYATKFTGSIEFTDSKVFSRAEVTPSENETTVKLFLKKKGAFYGWDSKYDSNGNLVLSFLEPATVSITKSNEYGVDLSGVTVLVDAGHGGTESGSYGIAHTTHEKKYHANFPHEKVFNLALANKVKAELEKMGATVVMTRSDDTKVEHGDRCKKLHDLAPDYCISIHHNGSPTNANANGFGAYHSSVFSSTPAKLVNQRTLEANIYTKCQPIKWHYFYLARMTACPVVLTENGFMTNADDYYNTIATAVTEGGKTYDIVNEEKNNAKAKAIVLGIADYFKSIQD